MPARVIHCRYAAQFPAADYVYCGRPSKWGNPFSVRRATGSERAARFFVDSRAEAIDHFRRWFFAPEQRELRQQALVELRDKVLGCWCKPKDCHVDIIAAYVNADPD